MIVIGAGAGAKELFEIMESSTIKFSEESLYFFDNTVNEEPPKILGKYRVLTSFEQVSEVFKTKSPEYCIGVGVPRVRYVLSNKFESLGGKLTTVISGNSYISDIGTSIKDGTTIQYGAFVSCNAVIGKGAMINLNVIIGHDVIIGDFNEIMPGVCITGHCKIGNYTSLGSGTIVTPNVTIGNNCIISAGTVVTKDIPDNSLVVGGMPGRIVEKLPEFKTDQKI